MFEIYFDKKDTKGKEIGNIPKGMAESEEELLYRLFRVRRKKMTLEEQEYLRRSNETSGEPA